MFFGKRREQERQRRLAVQLESADAEVRAAAAKEIAEARDAAWAVRTLAGALGGEPTPETFDAIAGPFCDALCRDRATRQRVEHMLASPVGDPAVLVREWTGFLAELGVGAAMETVDDDLADHVRGRLKRLRGQGWRHHELARMRPDSFDYVVAFGVAVGLVHEAVLQAAPLPAAEAERVRAETREALERALALQAESEERSDVLVALCAPDAERTWQDRARATLRLEEALTLCRSSAPERVTLGVDVLDCVLLLDEVMRHDAVREALEGVRATDPEPFTLAGVLRCYTTLHDDRALEDPPVDVFLTALDHPAEKVRHAAASGLPCLAAGHAREADAVAALIRTLEHDRDITVVRGAASSLALFVCEDPANTRAASQALARQADATDAAVRAASVEGALFREEPGSFGRLTRELQRPDVEPVFLGVAKFVCGLKNVTPVDVRAEWVGLLERLEYDGWPELPVDDELHPDVEDREELLQEVLDALRPSAS